MTGEYFDIISIIPSAFGLICLFSYFLKREIVDPRKLAYGATSTGVLLTFYGIWIGLIGFDVTDTDGSIPVLLEGLKTAFGSSIVGLFTSLFINLGFVSSKEPEEKSLENLEKIMSELKISLDDFTLNLTNANIEALSTAIESLITGLEMGINSETQETIAKFKESVEILRSWQEKYVDEIQAVTEAMDQNAIVTKASSDHLTRTNEVLSELKPVTETIAESIGWVQQALPAFRKRAVIKKEDDKKNE